jgi:hypothetical protein
MFTDRNEGCDYRIARSREEFRAAFRLVYDEYLKQGLTRPNRLGMRIIPHQLLQTSWVFTATLSEAVVATLSFVSDGQLGLPMDTIYRQEINRLREKSKGIAEVTCLANRPHRDESMWNRGKVWSTVGILMGHVLRVAVQRRIGDLVICIHPRHVTFYRRRYGFEKLGPILSCPWASDQPAQAMRLGERGILTALRATVLSDCDLQTARFQATMQESTSPEVKAYFRSLLEDVSPIPSRSNLGMTA